MRKKQKVQIIELLNTMLDGCKEIEKLDSMQKNLDMLEDCQQAAIQIGETIESVEGEGTQAVSCLEKYCEELFQVSELTSDESISDDVKNTYLKRYVAEMRNLLRATMDAVKSFENTIEMVFFPYKASMWDSLESIWIAANEDPRCHAVVVPIPYVDRNPDGSVKEEHYEINLYPEEVPVVDYRDYNLDEGKPDVAFIHNPYDQNNLVTSVHPNYYSYNLKPKVGKLVYVPYFALPGNLDKNYSDFSAYHYVDYIVTQTPEHRKSFPVNLPDEMFLPFGSPKFDAIIRRCKNPKPVPAEWKKKMEGKRVFFYNTSLRCAIGEPEDYLKKMGEVFKIFAGRDDVCLVWRPHPLLEATFDSMQPEYANVFRRLRELYISQGIGIYDDTPCMEDTISWCDAYLGDEGSSVVSSFGMAEKPIYILDNKIHQKPGERDYLGAVYRQIYDSEGDDRWIVTAQDELWHSPRNDYRYEFVCDLVEEYKTEYRDYYSRAKEINGKVYILPNNAQNVLVYEDGNLREIPLVEKVHTHGAFAGGIFTQKYIWLVPTTYPELVRINLTTEEVTYSKEAKEFLVDQKNGETIRGGINYTGQTLILSSPTSDELMFLDADTMETELLSLGYEDWKGTLAVSLGYRAYQSDKQLEDELWLLPMEGYDIIHFDLLSRESTQYCVKPEGFCGGTLGDGEVDDCRPFGSVIMISEEKSLLSPAWGNGYVLLDVNSGETALWNPPFRTSLQSDSIYMPSWGMGGFVGGRRKEVCDGCVRFADTVNRRLYEVTFPREAMKEVDISFSDYMKTEHEGFQKEYIYSCRENVFNSLEDMLASDNANLDYNVALQRAINEGINTSVKGECGKKVIEYVMGK